MLVAFNNIPIDAQPFIQALIINFSNSHRSCSQSSYSIKRDQTNLIVEQRVTDNIPKQLVLFDSRGRRLQKINLSASKINSQFTIPLSSLSPGFIIMAIQDKNGIRTISTPIFK